MEKLNLPDASVLVESLAKAKKGTKAKGISVFLAPGIDLPTGGGGYKNVDTLPSISEADDSMFYILPDGSLNYIKDNEWQTVSGGSGGAIAGEGLPSPALSVSLGTTYIDTTTGKYYVANRVGATTSWTEVETSGAAENIGVVYAYSEATPSIEVEWGDNCTLVSYDYAKYMAWCEANPSEWEEHSRNFNYESGLDAWIYYGDTDEIVIPADEMYATTGLELTLDDPEMGWAYCSIMTNVEVNKESEIIELPILNLLQFNTLSFPEAHAQATLGNDNTLVYSDAIKKVVLDWNKITYFPDSFLSYCYNLETIIDPDGSMGANVLDFRNIKAVGSDFMNYCAGLVIPPESVGVGIYIVNIHSDCQIGENFLSSLVYTYYDEGEYQQESYTGKITVFGDGKFGDYFLSQNVGVTEISCNDIREFGVGAFQGNSAMTHLTISSYVTSIGDSFCSGCSQLAYFGSSSSTVTFERLEKLGNGFLQDASAFNQSLKFPRLTNISGAFLMNCRSFNSPILLPALQFAGSNFMCGCENFMQPLELPNLISVGDFFLWEAQKFVGQLTVQNPGLAVPQGNNMLSVSSSHASSPMYQAGVMVYGAGRQAFLDLGNIDSGYYRRKLIDAGGGGGGTDDFNDLSNRPSYNGQSMTGSTNIPEVIHYTAGDGIKIEGNVISAGTSEPAFSADISYYTSGDVVDAWVADNAQNCQVTVDAANLNQELKRYTSLGFYYTNQIQDWRRGQWYFKPCAEFTQAVRYMRPYTTAELQEMGISVSITNNTSDASFVLRWQPTLTDKSAETTTRVDNLRSLCCNNTYTGSITIYPEGGGSLTLERARIYKITSNSTHQLTEIPDYFLKDFPNLESTQFPNGWRGIKTVGQGAFSNYKAVAQNYYTDEFGQDVIVKTGAFADFRGLLVTKQYNVKELGNSVGTFLKTALYPGISDGPISIFSSPVLEKAGMNVGLGASGQTNPAMPLLKSVGDWFLRGSSFTPISSWDRPTLMVPSLVSVGEHFGASANFSSVTAPNVAIMGKSFLSGCNNLNKFIAPLTIGKYALYDARELYAVDFGSLEPTGDSTSYAGAFATSDDNCSAYVNGITVYGRNRLGWMNKLPNSTTDPYRNLTDGGE